MGISGMRPPPVLQLTFPLIDHAGLLPLLKSIHRPTELKKYAGETFGVDGYGWLHRGAVACAIELAQGKPTRK
jgi:exonuclease-1